MKFQDSGAFYRSLFDHMSDGLAYCQMIFDKQRNPIDYIYIKTNKNFEKLTGLKKVVGKKATDVIPTIGKTNPELFEVSGRVALTGNPERFETYIEKLGIWLCISVYRLKKNFVVGVFQNITEQKQIEKNLENAKIAARNVYEDLLAEKERLAEAKAKDEALLESLGEGVVAVDQNGKVLVMNKIAEDLLGFTNKEARGILFLQLVFLEDEKGNKIPNKQRPMELALTLGRTTTTAVYSFVRKDGTKFPVAITATPVFLGKKIIGATTVFRNITKEKEIDRAKTEFVSLASHQLKTPPTAVKLLTERILTGRVGALTGKQKEYLNDIRSSNQRMIDLVNTLLSVSRIEMRTFAIETAEKDICAITQKMINELKLAINNKKLRFERVFPKDSVMVLIDEPLFHMVINNLLTNAINYTAKGGTIRFECRGMNKGQTTGGQLLTENCFVIIVSDTGCGIPKNQQGKLFTKFFRADNAKEKHPDGTGLGLYIVKSVLENSGGLIWFTSEENKGSTFYVAIPMTGMKARAGEKQLMSL